MPIKISPIPLGFDTCYVLQAEGVVAVDAGQPGKAKDFERGLAKLSVDPKEVRLIVITHGHWDHVGSAREIKEMTGAPLAMHAREADWLEKSQVVMPPGVTLWGRIFATLMRPFVPLVSIPSTKVDLRLGDDELALAEYGVPGKVIPTPGHSRGSVTVLLDTGEAFVGDLAMNRFPLRLGPGLPIFAEDTRQLEESWTRLLDEGATTVYPAHGKPFPAEVIRSALRS